MTTTTELNECQYEDCQADLELYGERYSNGDIRCDICNRMQNDPYDVESDED